ncbi:MAG: glycosyltransferase family 39 protein [bacterium]
MNSPTIEKRTASKRYVLFVAAGLFLVLLYFLLARELTFFIDPDLAYEDRERGRIAWGGTILQSFFRYFPNLQLSSMLWKFALLLPASGLLAWGLAGRGRSERGRSTNLPSPLIIVSGLCVVAAALICVIAFGALHRTPITDDEWTYLFQADLYRHGLLYAPEPPVPAAFQNLFIIVEGKYTGKYTFGHPLVLALGERLGSPYVMTLALSLGSLGLLFILGRLLFPEDKAVAPLALLLMTLSPFFFFTSATLLSHTTALFFLLLFCVCLLKTLSSSKLVYPLVAGLALGYAFNVRQLTALAFGAPLGILYLRRTLSNPKQEFLRFVLFLFGSGILLGLTMAHNYAITGSATKFPFQEYMEGERLGFGALLRHGAHVHTPAKGLVNLAVILLRLNTWLFGWPASLIFLGVAILLPAKLWGDKIILILLGCFFGAYWFYYSPGISDTGPVYYFEALPMLVLLSARGILVSHRGLQKFAEALGLNPARQFVPWFVAISFFFSFVFLVPEKAVQLSSLTDAVAEPYRVLREMNPGPSVIFVKSMPRAGWVFGYKNNDPFLQNEYLFVRDISLETDLQVMSLYPNRKYFLLLYDSRAAKSKFVPVEREKVEELLKEFKEGQQAGTTSDSSGEKTGGKTAPAPSAPQSEGP